MSTIRILDLECQDHGRSESLRPEGYAMLSVGGRTQTLHRVVYAEAHGLSLDAIKGKVIRHKCDNPRCIEPTHPEVGTKADNNRDRAERGRSAKRVPSRQSLSDTDVAAIRSRYVRYCRTNGAGAMARQYGVDQAYIHRIISGEER